MSSFFTIPAEKKRKRTDEAVGPKKKFATPKSAPRTAKPKAPRKPQRDDSISGSDAESENGQPESFFENPDAAGESSSASEAEDEEESAAQRRLRLAERYLENIREEVDEHGFDAEDMDRDLIAERLEDDAAESKGRIYRKLAAEFEFEQGKSSWFRNNTETVTSVATCPPYAYTVSKDMWLVKWRIQDLPRDQWPQQSKKIPKKSPPPPRKKPTQIAAVRGDKKKAKDSSYKGHVGPILIVVASQDGKYVVTGGKDRRIIVWDATTLKPFKVFTQHRDSVMGLAFRRGTNELYSASRDRTIKIWSLDNLAYVETLFGHQDEVVDIAALAQERCVSVGARDRTARLWKVVEETQLVFRGGGGGGDKKSRHGTNTAPKVLEGSMDRIAMIDEEMFVTGGDNGSISLWVTHKKKPIFTLSLTHGVEEPLKPEEYSSETKPNKAILPQPQPRWITALTTVPYSDVILSGSWDGYVRMWKVSEDKKKLEALGVLGSSAVDNALNGGTDLVDGEAESHTKQDEASSLIKGVINDISVFERGDRGKDGACIVVAVGKEHRLGRWKTVHGKNGAVVFEVPRRERQKANGAIEAAKAVEE